MRSEAVDPAVWVEVSRRWLEGSLDGPGGQPGNGARIGIGDLESFRKAIGRLAADDDRLGGGYARKALLRQLSTKAGRLLRGQCGTRLRREVLCQVSEATLLVGWMTYDIAPASALAQRYFTEALALAHAGGDRLLGADILDAMSQQAISAGRLSEAIALTGAALAGTQGHPVRTLTAHLHTMKARALARQGQAKACVQALSAAIAEFDSADPNNDPEWIGFFEESELCAEIAQCARDLGRVKDALRYSCDGQVIAHGRPFGRSACLSLLQLADAHLAAGDAGQACGEAMRAVADGAGIKSARCAHRLNEFSSRLAVVAPAAAANLRELARHSRLGAADGVLAGAGA